MRYLLILVALGGLGGNEGDEACLEKMAGELRARGSLGNAQLEQGDPATEILKTAEIAGCDLVAMTSHGHRFSKDFLYGSKITQVRHLAKMPVLW